MSEQNIITIEGDERESSEVIPLNPMMQLVKEAVLGDVPMDKLDRLMDLEERRNKEHFRQRFENALAQAKPNYRDVKKTGRSNYGAYHTLADLDEAVCDALAEKGISYRWSPSQADGKMTVTCIMSGHGHIEETSLTSSLDSSGSKNGVQQIGSTQKYLMRYTLEAAAGVALADNDDDGAGASAAAISDAAQGFIDRIRRAGMDGDAETIRTIGAKISQAGLTVAELERVRAEHSAAKAILQKSGGNDASAQ